MRVTEPNASTVENRRRFVEREGLPYDRLVSALLVHGSRVQAVTEQDAGSVIPSCDGLVTGTSKLVLSVTGADCFPLYIVDPVRRAIGLIHGGWRGLASGIIPESLLRFRELGSNPADLFVGIGPGIHACHFEVQENVLTAFQEYRNAVVEKDGKTFLDLPKIIRTQLRAGGVLASNIEDSGACTYELQETYFSRRRDKEGELQVMMAYLLLE